MGAAAPGAPAWPGLAAQALNRSPRPANTRAGAVSGGCRHGRALLPGQIPAHHLGTLRAAPLSQEELRAHDTPAGARGWPSAHPRPHSGQVPARLQGSLGAARPQAKEASHAQHIRRLAAHGPLARRIVPRRNRLSTRKRPPGNISHLAAFAPANLSENLSVSVSALSLLLGKPSACSADLAMSSQRCPGAAPRAWSW